MKSVFFALALMLIGSFSFASNGEEVFSENITIDRIELIVNSKSGDFNVVFPTTISMLESTVADLNLLDCTISGSVSYGGAKVEFSVTADTCAEAWDGVKHIISDSLGLE